MEFHITEVSGVYYMVKKSKVQMINDKGQSTSTGKMPSLNDKQQNNKSRTSCKSASIVQIR